MRSSCLALGLVALVAATARGQDAAPVISELQIDNRLVTSVAQGSVVTAMGRNFHQCPPLPEPEPGRPPPRNTCRHEELHVRLGDENVLLLDCTSERVMFIVPQDTRPGRVRLTISVRGRGAASVHVDVVVVPPPPPRPAGPDPEERAREEFRIARFDLVRDEAGARFVVSGPAIRVPDGFSLVLTLAVNQRDLEQTLAVIDDGWFEVTFGPYTRELVYGNYAATTLFELAKNPRVRVRDFRRTIGREEAEIYDRIERREFLQVGTQEDVATQLAAMQAHYKVHADELLRLLGEAEAWRARPFVPAAYVAWAENTFVPALKKAFHRHREFRDATIAPIEPRGELPADHLVSIVLETFLQSTRELYQGANLAVPESLLGVPDVDPVRCAEVSRAHFEAQHGLLLRTVGLAPPAQGR